MALWYACWEGGAAGSKSRMYGGGCPRPPARTDELAAAVSAIPDATTRASVIDGGPRAARACEPRACRGELQGPPPRARALALLVRAAPARALAERPCSTRRAASSAAGAPAKHRAAARGVLAPARRRRGVPGAASIARSPPPGAARDAWRDRQVYVGRGILRRSFHAAQVRMCYKCVVHICARWARYSFVDFCSPL